MVEEAEDEEIENTKRQGNKVQNLYADPYPVTRGVLMRIILYIYRNKDQNITSSDIQDDVTSDYKYLVRYLVNREIIIIKELGKKKLYELTEKGSDIAEKLEEINSAFKTRPDLMECPQCGENIKKHSNFCRMCGLDLDSYKGNEN